jgi:hypothetical protein
MNTGCRSSDETADKERDKTDAELAEEAILKLNEKLRADSLKNARTIAISDSLKTIHRESNKIKVTLVNLVCELSDDEGPGNDVDMDIFKFTLDAKQNECANENTVLTSGNIIYSYTDASITVATGAVWFEGNKSTEIIFNNTDCTPEKLTVTITGYARDQDASSSSDDEEANNSITISGGSVIGTHIMHLKSSDFDFRCIFTIEKIGDW